MGTGPSKQAGGQHSLLTSGIGRAVRNFRCDATEVGVSLSHGMRAGESGTLPRIALMAPEYVRAGR